MGTKWTLILLAMCGVACLASQASAFGGLGLGNYVALKGGVYSPSASFNFDNINIETAFRGDTQTGFDGELAYGHYFLPTLALELGVGYFKGTGTYQAVGLPALGARRNADFTVIPVLLSAKALIPVGRVDPYGELGVGSYFTKFNVGDNLNTFNGTTTFGIHTGVGMNVNITQNAFIGVEGRYVWANPSFGGQKIKLNNTDYTLNGFKLNGFTTTFALGFSF
jgi:outer membrane protein W